MIKREEQKKENKWNLESMYNTPSLWTLDYQESKAALNGLESFKGKLGQDKATLLLALQTLEKESIRAEKVAVYAFLTYSVDAQSKESQNMKGLADQLLTEFSQRISYFNPELMSLDSSFINEVLEDKDFKNYKVMLEKTLRFKEHTLDLKSENILALYGLVSSSSYDTFALLTNVDMKFKSVNGKELTNSTYSVLISDKNEEIRKEAYINLYTGYLEHQNTLSSLYSSQVNSDIFLSKTRLYKSCLERALFPDDVSPKVYTSLIEAVHEAFPSLHRYYALRAKLMHKDKLKHYDMYVPVIEGFKTNIKYEEAVEIIRKATLPLGEDYSKALCEGLTKKGWVDRYENEGKRQGAFSSGCYVSEPFIMTNYNDEILSSVFTLIHEGGHSMHSKLSKENNPYFSSEYTIFEAEVASTFNEQLLQYYLKENAKSNKEKAYYISKHLDDIVATLFRQTMFAEFELIAHQNAEKGEVLTVSSLRELYRSLLISYFGPSVEFEDISDLECLRIPHFYTSFYTYKYATGISAAIALSEKVLNGGEKEREDYLSFLKSGGSLFPIENLKKAGVDMSTKIPVEEATKYFSKLLDELESLISENA